MNSIISQNSFDNADLLKTQFQNNTPFKHICVDNFLEDSVCQGLISEFPTFTDSRAVNEFGEYGSKDVNWELQAIGPHYKAVHDSLVSGEFTRWLSSVTGIEDLVWGGENTYGGGTHENLNDAELDIHLDFNFDDRNQYHRRINVLIYLNPEWDADWGGSLELHKDPRIPATNEVKAFPPIANRAVIHETNDHSWHGFRRIRLPEGKQHLSRRSLALYFYTKDRPQEEIRGNHTTHYIHWPLPDSFQVGAEVTREMHQDIHRLVSKRDGFINFFHDKEVEQAATIKHLGHRFNELLDRATPPLMGYVTRQVGKQIGFFEDGWIAPRFSMGFIAQRPVKKARLRLAVPENHRGDYVIEGRVGETPFEVRKTNFSGGIDIECKAKIKKGDDFKIVIKTRSEMANPTGGDQRDIAILLQQIEFDHA
jgi:hypothetical protein